MFKPEIRIDHSLFVFDCINILNKEKEYIFTYKIDTSKNISDTIKKYFLLLKKLNQYKFLELLLDNYTKNNKYPKNHEYHFHIVNKKDQWDKIEKIYLQTQNFSYDNEWISQNILLSNIYQIKLDLKNSDHSRVMFIMDKNNSKNLITIKPLFIDVNHLIYPDDNFSKNYDKCLICHQSECS